MGAGNILVQAETSLVRHKLAATTKLPKRATLTPRSSHRTEAVCSNIYQPLEISDERKLSHVRRADIFGSCTSTIPHLQVKYLCEQQRREHW